MPSPSFTYTLTNGTTADADQVMQNFNDLLNGVTDGTKDLSISALTVAGTATFNGAMNLGNATGDDITVTGSLASNLPIKTNTTYGIGGSTLGLSGIYFGGSSTFTARIVAATLAASRTYTMPDAGAAAEFVMNAGASSISGLKTFNDGLKVDDAGGQSTINYFAEGTWSPDPTGSGSGYVAGTVVARYTRINKWVFVNWTNINFDTDGVDTLSMTLPFTAKTSSQHPMVVVNNSTGAAGRVITTAGSVTCTPAAAVASTAFTGTTDNNSFYAIFAYECE